MRTFAIVVLMVMGCAKQAPPTPATSTPPPEPATASGPRVTFPDGFVVSVEVVADPELRAQGLMYRDQLRPGTGMLFFFPEEGEYPFWMKNTRIALDIIWIDTNLRIAHVKHDVPPCRTENCPSYAPDAQARYVLEVAAGVAKEHGLKTGDVLKFEGTEGIVVRD